ncbi:hypothetical protein QYE76_024721 [Lolium multiflorum]|uniref:ribose-5-phosphate isomerase n=1 Tax=Lolium multiflorum TaxID=4521 RepID=A0AAD8VTX1_LOLMU|nr:hypothetical protein QYE76_024721 [Lolium multiflorum]
MKRFIVELGVVPSALDPLVIYCDNMGVIANAQEPRISLTIDGGFQLDLPRRLPAPPGTASTAAHALGRLADLLRTAALRLVAGKTEAHAARDAFPMLALAVAAEVYLYIDGADEVDPDLNLVKGRASSLLREKMIDGAGGRFVFTVNESELVPRLSCTGVVHVEFVPFLLSKLRRVQVQLVESSCWSTFIVCTGYGNVEYPKGYAHVSPRVSGRSEASGRD